jgi:triacylglycerol lipase
MEIMNIVLAHGLLGRSSLANLEYFHGVRAHLEKQLGATVLATSAPPIGTIEKRANALAAQIVAKFGRREPVHVLAHSMGGLDARMVIAKDMESLRTRIKTLVCIGTPHHGSPVASMLDRANPLRLLRGSIFQWLIDHTNAVHDLSEKRAQKFNDECRDCDSVTYVNIAGVGRKGPIRTSLFFQPTYRLIGDPNDGVVPYVSASRGGTPYAVWYADHADLIGHDLDRPGASPSPARLRAYAEVVRRFIAVR